MIKKLSMVAAVLLAANTGGAFASGNNVGKIVNPYVQQTEQELEYELLVQDDDRLRFDGRQLHKLDYGRALSDRWLVELGVAMVKRPDNSFKIHSYELEAKLQLTEQGEFSNDWALLFELERERDPDNWEASATVIALREWQRWVGTVNLSLIYETGDRKDEVESALASQLKYRYKASLEPAIEYFKNQDTNAIGPALLGQVKLQGRKKLYWEAGAAFSLDRSRPDTTFRASIEFEF